MGWLHYNPRCDHRGTLLQPVRELIAAAQYTSALELLDELQFPAQQIELQDERGRALHLITAMRVMCRRALGERTVAEAVADIDELIDECTSDGDTLLTAEFRGRQIAWLTNAGLHHQARQLLGRFFAGISGNESVMLAHYLIAQATVTYRRKSNDDGTWTALQLFRHAIAAAAARPCLAETAATYAALLWTQLGEHDQAIDTLRKAGVPVTDEPGGLTLQTLLQETTL